MQKENKVHDCHDLRSSFPSSEQIGMIGWQSAECCNNHQLFLWHRQQCLASEQLFEALRSATLAPLM